MAGKPKQPVYVEPRPHVGCCYQNCMECALCRVWTKTGWANVCLTHYAKIEIAPRPKTNNLLTLELREAYQESPHYRRLHGSQKTPEQDEIRRQVAAELEARRLANQREPGSDDELERELMDRAQP